MTRRTDARITVLTASQPEAKIDTEEHRNSLYGWLSIPIKPSNQVDVITWMALERYRLGLNLRIKESIDGTPH